FPGAVQPDAVNHPDWWVPCNHPQAEQAGLSCTPPPRLYTTAKPSVAVPSEDEYVTILPYGPGSAPQQYMVRTANRAMWLQSGKVYRHPYNITMRVDRTEFRCEDIGYGEVCDLFQIGVVLDAAQTSSTPGQEISFRLFAPTEWVLEN
ncbi:MAG: hypothetical protein ACHQX3_09185, partial [Nitrospirales bacterium]